MAQSLLTEDILFRIRTNAVGDADPDIIALLRHAADTGLADDELEELTAAIAESSFPPEEMGIRARRGLSVVKLAETYTDIASTGGPGSLTTLAAPILLTLMGERVLKIAERGTPAGGVDVLEVLAGFRSVLDPIEIESLARHTSYIHARQGKRFAPADATLIRVRRNEELMASPDLAIASLVAKKIASGLSRCVLDVRIGTSGNVGNTIEAGIRMSQRFTRTARAFGIDAVCVLSDLRDRPPTPYLGRSEALRGLVAALGFQAPPLHMCLMLQLCAEALSLNGHGPDDVYGIVTRARQARPIEALARLLAPQGIESSTLERRLLDIEAFEEIPIPAARGGTIQSVSPRGLKRAVKDLYDQVHPDDPFQVWEVGLYWEKSHGLVDKGEALGTIRVHPDFAPKIASAIPAAIRAAQEAAAIGDATPGPLRQQLLAVVDQQGQVRDPVLSIDSCNRILAATRELTPQ